MLKKIFNLVYDVLIFISNLTGFSYKEVNIIIWYIIIPLFWCILIDKIIKRHYLKIAFTLIVVITLLSVKSFSEFSNQLFDASADFLRSFNAVGSNYTTSSVVICVVIPIAISVYLIKKAFKKESL